MIHTARNHRRTWTTFVCQRFDKHCTGRIYWRIGVEVIERPKKEPGRVRRRRSVRDIFGNWIHPIETQATRSWSVMSSLSPRNSSKLTMGRVGLFWLYTELLFSSVSLLSSLYACKSVLNFVYNVVKYHVTKSSYSRYDQSSISLHCVTIYNINH